MLILLFTVAVLFFGIDVVWPVTKAFVLYGLALAAIAFIVIIA